MDPVGDLLSKRVYTCSEKTPPCLLPPFGSHHSQMPRLSRGKGIHDQPLRVSLWRMSKAGRRTQPFLLKPCPVARKALSGGSAAQAGLKPSAATREQVPLAVAAPPFKSPAGDCAIAGRGAKAFHSEAICLLWEKGGLWNAQANQHTKEAERPPFKGQSELPEPELLLP